MVAESKVWEPEMDLEEWLTDYKAEHGGILAEDPEFASWLEDCYVPVAGGWQF